MTFTIERCEKWRVSSAPKSVALCLLILCFGLLDVRSRLWGSSGNTAPALAEPGSTCHDAWKIVSRELQRDSNLESVLE